MLDETTRCQLNVYRGVTPLLMDYATSTDELISMSVAKAKSAGLVQDGDLVVVTAGVPVGISGTTNMITVSYTHLDVYKRQALLSIFWRLISL